MFRGNPEHTGVYDDTGVAKFSQVKWKFHTAGQVISSPAVSGGVVFVGSTDGNFYAVDRESGTLKWKFAAKSRITSSPAVADGQAYFAAYDGNFYAVNATSGQLTWKFQTGGQVGLIPAQVHGALPPPQNPPHPLKFFAFAAAYGKRDIV